MSATLDESRCNCRREICKTDAIKLTKFQHLTVWGSLCLCPTPLVCLCFRLLIYLSFFRHHRDRAEHKLTADVGRPLRLARFSAVSSCFIQRLYGRVKDKCPSVLTLLALDGRTKLVVFTFQTHNYRITREDGLSHLPFIGSSSSHWSWVCMSQWPCNKPYGRTGIEWMTRTEACFALMNKQIPLLAWEIVDSLRVKCGTFVKVAW